MNGHSQEVIDYHEHFEVRHNRRIKTAPRQSGLFWCTGCDGCMVYVGQICPRCGWKHSKETTHLRH